MSIHYATPPTCPARLGSLTCSRPGGHEYGHVYEFTYAPDGRHDDAAEEWA